MNFRFLQTGDWQLGMTRRYFSEDAQERYSQSRFDAVRAIGRIAREQQCRFVLVCGDTFESNQVDRKTVARTLEALREVPVPVFLLPGNHDPLNEASVYRSSVFLERKPEHVQVIVSTDPIRPADGIEVRGAPWLSKRPAANPLEALLAGLAPESGVFRICAGHGAIDQFTPDASAPGVISVETLENAIDEGKVHYVALGDRHSRTRIGQGERIWYAGSPEATDFDEVESGFVQVVEVGDAEVVTRSVRAGRWRFLERDRVDLNGAEEVEALGKWLHDIERKDLTVVRLRLVGSLSLSLRDRLQNHLDAATDVLGALEVREEGLLVLPDDADFADLGFSGFAESTVNRLREGIAAGGEDARTAREALMLLLRLARMAS